MSKQTIIPEEVIMSKIYEVRDQKIMLDRDLATLYQVETKQLKRQVRRNIERFPEDFMFELTQEEFDDLRSQIGTSNQPNGNPGWGGTRYTQMAFTEQGVSMLSSVLNSKTAIRINIHIIRIFTRMREMLLTQKDLLLEMEEIRKKVSGQDEKIALVFSYLKQFIKEKEIPRKKIGFK